MLTEIALRFAYNVKCVQCVFEIDHLKHVCFMNVDRISAQTSYMALGGALGRCWVM